MKVSGVNTMIRVLTNLVTSRGPVNYKTALIKVMLKVQRNAMKRTPVDTGNLRSSFGTVVTEATPAGATGVVHNTAEYAIYVHDRTDLKHTVGEAKFLWNAVSDEAPKMARQLGLRLRATMFKKDLV